MELIFWICLALLVYTYAGYFVLVTLVGPLVRRRHHTDDKHTPSVTMVVSLHNEEIHIDRLIDSFEALEYPTTRKELLLGDDCSTDRTRELIRARMAQNDQIRLVEFDVHPGKTEVINQLVPQATGEILAFSDANTFWQPTALRLLARHYADPRVGAVGGRLVLRSSSGVNTDDAYWQFETLLKQRENDLGVQLGAPGGIYTMRKSLFHPLKSDVIQIDDFIWPVSVYWQGCIGVNEPGAVAHEEAAPHVEAEFRRKIRIGTGDFRALYECRRLLLPWLGWVSFAFWSHKVIRWSAPILLLLVLMSNAFLLAQPLYRALFGLQIAFYSLALFGRLLSHQKHFLAKICRVPYYFVGGNIALAIGFVKCATGRQKATWTQTLHRT